MCGDDNNQMKEDAGAIVISNLEDQWLTSCFVVDWRVLTSWSRSAFVPEKCELFKRMVSENLDKKREA